MNKLKENLISIIKSIAYQAITLILLVVSIRITEFFALSDFFYESKDSKLVLWANAMRNEGLFLIIYLLIGGVIFALVETFSKRAYKILFAVFIILLVLTYLIGTQYYYSANLLLDRLIFYFSFEELMAIAKSEVQNLSGSFFTYYIIIICVTISLLMLHFRLPSIKKARLAAIGIFFSALSLTIVGVSFFSENEWNKREIQITTSKPYFFLKSIIGGISFTDEQEDHYTIVKRFRKLNNWKPSKHQQQYPFIHEYEEEQGNLNQFFNPFTKPPDLVMVFCEGLSSIFSGTDAYYGSMTPYLDSIYKKGLYWPNTLSNADLTHGVFANALASMPHGFERGVLNLRLKKFPEHYSLPKFLISNGYDASFSYGGWAYFDNYEPFMKMNYVDKVYGEAFFKKNYEISEYSSEEFSWGIHDAELFDLYINLKEEHKTESPFFDLILSLSLHSPFLIPDQERYVKLARQRFMKVNGDMDLFERYEKVWTSILYQDEAIGNFIKKYKERIGFENTIFVLVGDHKVHEIRDETDIQRHHVPLVIYSDKLKVSKQFNDIVGHPDIPISLFKLIQPYLKEGNIPLYSNWLGRGLSTDNKLSADHPIYIGDYSGEVTGLLIADTLLMYDELYKIKKQFRWEKINAEKVKLTYQRQLGDYKYLNRYVLENNRLMLEQDVLSFPNREAALYFPE